MTKYRNKSYNSAVIGTESAELLRWYVRPAGDEMRVTLTGEMDMSNAPELSDALRVVLESRPLRVVVDLTNLSYLDSCGIRCLLNAAERAAEVGCDLAVHNPSRNVRRVLELTGVADSLLDESSEPAAESH